MCLKFFRIGLAPLGIAIVLAGCGGGTSSNPGTTTTATASSSACPKGGTAAGTTAAQTVDVVPDPNTVGAFKPQNISVKVGDSVEWDWKDQSNPHTVTANGGTFDSCVQNAGFKFVVTFSTAGDFPYHCTLHSGMLGDVKVS